MLKNLLLLTVIAFVFTACISEDKQKLWFSFIYADKNNTENSVVLKYNFTSLEACQENSQQYLKEMNILQGAYKCGLNCVYNDSLDRQICEKMI